ncbi:hypothetical protein RJ639_043179 [Escallonia herrerae]|uniref:Ankyrin repeat-containing domain-containing protein n=1 Tax=Escallonia herrerae TaxID=1293975 RepID=A0AA89B2P9_9ASTE|nr:hypothetical protein RJ639_043179 [Escallonia herrerae]
MASLLSSSTTPKYPYPHELNIVSLVPIKLSLKTFFVWRKLMLDVVENQGLLGFIDGTTVSPLERTTVPDDGSVTGTMEIENQDYKDWKRTDQLLLRWFLSTLEAQGRLAFQGCPSAKAMWMMLEKMFNQFREPSERVINEEAGKNLSHYLPLHRAALKGDWESANNFIEKEPDSVRAIITGYLETALMVAVRSGQRKHFLKKLLQLMLPADLTVADRLGITALHIAAGVGNVEVAKLLVQKNPDTPDVPDIGKSKPLLIAALHGRRNMFSYLITVTKEDVEPRPFDGQSGSMLLQALLFNELYGLQYGVHRIRSTRIPTHARTTEGAL